MPRHDLLFGLGDLGADEPHLSDQAVQHLPSQSRQTILRLVRAVIAAVTPPGPRAATMPNSAR